MIHTTAIKTSHNPYIIINDPNMEAREKYYKYVIDFSKISTNEILIKYVVLFDAFLNSNKDMNEYLMYVFNCLESNGIIIDSVKFKRIKNLEKLLIELNKNK